MRVRDAHADIMSTVQESATKLHDRLDELDARTYAIGVGMTEWNPVLTDEQLERILATRESLSIPQHAALLVADVARYGTYKYRTLIGNGSFIGCDWELHPDGRIKLELTEPNGSRFWAGTFRAPA
jgi:hypothetical protein